MLPKDKELAPSKYAELYDILIPKDNVLRRLIEMVDFSFVNDEVAEKYSIDMGRTAVDPVQMFKYLFLKVFYNLSDRDLVNRAKTDLSLKFFLGLNPEDDVIHPSLLSKFRRQRLKDVCLLKLLIKKSVDIAIENNVLQKGAVIVDATHTVSTFNQRSPILILRKASKILRKNIYEVDNSIKKDFPEVCKSRKLSDEQEYTDKLLSTVKSKPYLLKRINVMESFNNLEELKDDLEEYNKYSKDPDARIGHKSEKHSFFGFKTHLAMSDNRIITAAVVTGGEQGDGKYLEKLIKESNDNGMEIKEVLGDRAYSGKKNLQYTENNNINLVSKLSPIISNGTRNPNNMWDFNKDAGMIVCPGGNMATRKLIRDKAIKGKKGENRNKCATFFFDINLCKSCPLREGCYKAGAQTKSYSVTMKSDEHSKQLGFEESKYFNERAKDRYKIEAKNAEIKTKHGYDRSWSSGITSMTLQGGATIFCANLKRILKLMDEED